MGERKKREKIGRNAGESGAKKGGDKREKRTGETSGQKVQQGTTAGQSEACYVCPKKTCLAEVKVDELQIGKLPKKKQ